LAEDDAVQEMAFVHIGLLPDGRLHMRSEGTDPLRLLGMLDVARATVFDSLKGQERPRVLVPRLQVSLDG